MFSLMWWKPLDIPLKKFKCPLGVCKSSQHTNTVGGGQGVVVLPHHNNDVKIEVYVGNKWFVTTL